MMHSTPRTGPARQRSRRPGSRLSRLGVPAAAFVLVLAGAMPSAAAVPSVDAVSAAGARSAVMTPAQLPVAWTVGGHSAGTESAGQGARVSVDLAGNVTVVSGPSRGRDLAVTSYTVHGVKRWRRSITPVSGTMQADWVVAAPSSDVIAVGHSLSSSGKPIAVSLVRYAADGHRQWREDVPGVLPSVGRLVVDATGNAYLAFSSLGDGQDIHLHKYSPGGDLLWSATINTGLMSNDIASSLALTPDGAQVVLTGSTSGGATWITAVYDTASGSRSWLVADDGIGTAARDLAVSDDQVYVTGQGNVGGETSLTVVGYDLATGQQQWRTDNRPDTDHAGAAGLRIALAPSGDLVVAGQAGSNLDWWIVSLTSDGAVRWTARRDRRLSDEVPAAVFVLPDGTAVVSGHGGPELEGGFVRGVTAGYSPDGAPKWEAYAPLASTWAVPLPDGNICATGGYDALITCWRIPRTGS